MKALPTRFIFLGCILLNACGGGGSETSNDIALACNHLASGESETRTRYLDAQSSNCQSEIQIRQCDDGELSNWTGNYTYLNCSDIPSEDTLPLIDISQLQYLGGFRLSTEAAGSGDYPTLNYSPAPIVYNSSNHSLFVVGHAYEQGIAEFAIPNIVSSRDINDFEVGSTILQNFTDFHQTERVDTGIDNYFKVTGMALIEGQLIVNYMNWYDAGGQETDTSVVFKDAHNLATSQITGPFQLNGAAHAAGWLTPIPSQWQQQLGGTHIAGHAHGSIISRLSVGPTAFSLTPQSNLLNHSDGTVPTNALLDFSLANMLYNQEVYDHEFSGSRDDILYNRDGRNDLWTINSGAAYGFIIPNTNTYMTLGMSAGHHSGIGYKITQDNGHLCGGPCPYEADDKYNYFWLWRVSDLVKVKSGELSPYDLRPYQYGELDSPSKAPLLGASYDAENQRLYVALKEGDTVTTYNRPPLFLAYDLNLD